MNEATTTIEIQAEIIVKLRAEKMQLSQEIARLKKELEEKSASGGPQEN